MPKSKTQTHRLTSQIETLEERLAMTADPIGGLTGGALEHHSFDEPPVLNQHLEQHVATTPDFWRDEQDPVNLDQYFDGIEQQLNSAHNLTGLPQVRKDYGFTGKGQTVAVIDSGIAYDHFALGGGLGSNYRVVGGWDFAENDGIPYDDGARGSHGTHVAGIIGSTDSTHQGVSPGVDLVGLRVFNDDGAGYFHWVEDALEWIHTHKDSFENPITAVNLSLGVSNWNSETIPNWANLEEEFAQLEADGIFVAVSAGNSYTSFNSNGLSYPASSQYVIPVMSATDSDNLSYFSQRHQRAIAAPGHSIYSTVPDYNGNNNGITDDFRSKSGTSMASPYVAGASTLIRQAMEFVGQTNITQDTIYSHMITWADDLVDSTSGDTFSRLNLQAAIDALIPTDKYGSTADAAHNLGTVHDVAEISGMIGKLDDADFFSFTAGATGKMTIQASSLSHDLAAEWTASGATVSGENGEILTLNVTAGQTYTVGLSSSDGLGYFDLEFSLDAVEAFNPVDWGTFAQGTRSNVSVNSEGWYRIEASQAGIMTVQSQFHAAGGDVTLELYDENQQLITAGDSRLDTTTTAGQTFYIRAIGTNADVDFQMTNLVSLEGGTFTVSGTDAADTFSLSSGTTHTIEINGVSYSFDTVHADTIEFNGNGGADTLTVAANTDTTINLTSIESVSDLNGAAFALNADLNLKLSSSSYINWGGWGEKWVQSDSGWHFITPSGELYRFQAVSGNDLSGSTLVATLDSSFHSDLSKLTEAMVTDFMLENQAASLDSAYGLYSDGDYHEDWGGRGELWIRSTQGGWYFITPEGGLYRWNGSSDLSTSELKATLSSDYHTDPTKLFDASENSSLHADAALEVDSNLGLAISGSYAENWGGWGEKWIRSEAGDWCFITPSGGLYEWNGSANLAGSKLVASFDSTYHTDPTKLHEAAASGHSSTTQANTAQIQGLADSTVTTAVTTNVAVAVAAQQSTLRTTADQTFATSVSVEQAPTGKAIDAAFNDSGHAHAQAERDTSEVSIVGHEESTPDESSFDAAFATGFGVNQLDMAIAE